MPAHEELPTLDTADLSKVTGGTASDMSSMLLPMLMMRNRAQPAAAAPAPAPAVPAWTPKITVGGVDQTVTPSSDGTFTTSTDV
ncbi:MAG: hypothetical protein E6J91_42105 [Deltaproteobacteria bacterium]|nr:MAG: hypothetical protein E6J91_42105 [Deltaproteobacteria bacterium]